MAFEQWSDVVAGGCFDLVDSLRTRGRGCFWG